MPTRFLKSSVTAFMVFGTPTFAQSEAVDQATGDDVAAEDLLDEQQLEELVGPVALYPDTLLIQVLVASTYPLDVIKADRIVEDNAALDAPARKELISAQDYDDSIEVLAEAFPDVLSDMADHVEWTETMGTAMLAQTDDVLGAIQRLRTKAVANGALESGEQQTVEVTQNETIIIQPTDPQVVYVPQYQPSTVFVDSGPNYGDAVAAGLIAWGTVAIIDEIFDDNDDWYGYWGCRNCGGWNGAPIIRDPDIDIDVDGNVNIGNRVDFDRGDINIDRDKVSIDRDRVNIDRETLPGEWRPSTEGRKDAREKIASRETPGGGTKLPLDKGASRGDALRGQLAGKTGVDTGAAAAIGAAGGAAAAGTLNRRPEAGSLGTNRQGGQDLAGRVSGAERPTVNRPNVDRPARTQEAAQSLKRNSGASRANIRPAESRQKASPARQPQRAASGNRANATALQQRGSGSATRAASNRGKVSRSGGKRR